MNNPPTLTQEEFAVAKSSIWFNSYLFTDGRGNLTPEANIAVLRGANINFLAGGLPTLRDKVIVDKAMRDLAAYLGFTNVNEYNSALMTQGNRIFDGVQPPPVAATNTYPFPVIVEGGKKETPPGNPAGVSTGIAGPAPHDEPSLFDTGYYYNGIRVGGTGQADYGNTGGKFQG